MKKIVLAIISLLFYANVSHSALWIKIGLEDKTVSSVACNSQNGNIYAVADNLLYLSEIDGLDWTLLNLDVNQPWVHVYRVLVDAKGRIYAGTNNGIYCSDNADHSFRAINTGLPHPPNVTAICCPDINSLAIGTNAGFLFPTKTAYNGPLLIEIYLREHPISYSATGNASTWPPIRVFTSAQRTLLIGNNVFSTLPET